VICALEGPALATAVAEFVTPPTRSRNAAEQRSAGEYAVIVSSRARALWPWAVLENAKPITAALTLPVKATNDWPRAGELAAGPTFDFVGTKITEAAPPFVVFERWAPRTLPYSFIRHRRRWKSTGKLRYCPLGRYRRPCCPPFENREG
jgi:hypothetical protein